MITYPKKWHKTEKYLAYDHLEKHSGFLHKMSDLDTLCREAVLANRIPVLSKNFLLSEFHNPAGSIPSSWERYWDLKETTAYIYRYYLFSKQMVYQTNYSIPVLWLDDIDDWIDKKSYRSLMTERLINSGLDECELIYRKLSGRWRPGAFHKIYTTQSNKEFLKEFYQLIRYGYWEEICFHRQPSLEVWTVVDDIVRQLGTDFWAMHIRRSDVLYHPHRPHTRHASYIPWVMANLKCARLDSSTPLFLMTDERDPVYLTPLQKKFNVIQATDFESYRNLASKYKDDNFLCFHIERLIFQQAKRRYKNIGCFCSEYEFVHFPKPMLIKFNQLPPYSSLSDDCELKYISYLSLERRSLKRETPIEKKSLKNILTIKKKWPYTPLSKDPYINQGVNRVLQRSLLIKYGFAQIILHLRLGLRRCLEKAKA